MGMRGIVQSCCHVFNSFLGHGLAWMGSFTNGRGKRSQVENCKSSETEAWNWITFTSGFTNWPTQVIWLETKLRCREIYFTPLLGKENQWKIPNIYLIITLWERLNIHICVDVCVCVWEKIGKGEREKINMITLPL